MDYGLDDAWMMVGPCVLALCFFIKTMGIITEVHSTYEAIRAVLLLRGNRTIVKISDEIEIISISNTRVFCFLGVQLCRIVIAVWLWYGGAVFLTHTIDVPDLVLNTGADVCHVV